jgi:hypothetical protein
VEAEDREYDPSEPWWLPEYFRADVRLNRYWQPLLILSLYNREFFSIPGIFESEENWELTTLEFSDPKVYHEDENEVPSFRYEIAESEWERFEAFRNLCEQGLQVCSEWEGIRLAARRYLRGMFLTDPSMKLDDKDVEEDILLQYIMALEALLTGDDKEGMRNKIATQAALLAARDDEEREYVRSLVKNAYDRRSDIVHGRPSKKVVPLDELRQVCQRVLSVILVSAVNASRPDQPKDWLSQLPISDNSLDRFRQARDQVLVTIAERDAWRLPTPRPSLADLI